MTTNLTQGSWFAATTDIWTSDGGVGEQNTVQTVQSIHFKLHELKYSFCWIEHDFTMMFGEEVTGRFLARWP